jgi:hypothetical protein
VTRVACHARRCQPTRTTWPATTRGPLVAEPAGVSRSSQAGEGNRTLVFSLEGCGSTIELHPQSSNRTRCRHQTSYFRTQRCSRTQPSRSLHWGVQDSNLRRQSHQIYSLTPLTARETPRHRVQSWAPPHLSDRGRPRPIRSIDRIRHFATLKHLDVPSRQIRPRERCHPRPPRQGASGGT